MKLLRARWREAGDRLAAAEPATFATVTKLVQEFACRRTDRSANPPGLEPPKAVKAATQHLDEHRRRLAAAIAAIDTASAALQRRERLAAGECDQGPGCSGGISIAWCRDCGTTSTACDAHGRFLGARNYLAHHAVNALPCAVALVGLDPGEDEAAADLRHADEALAALWAMAMREAGTFEKARDALRAGDRNRCDLGRPGRSCTGAIHVRWCACCGDVWRRCKVHGGLRGATHAHDQHMEATHSRRGAETTPETVASSPR